MSDFFIGQIMLTGFGFAQRNFAQCNGQTLPISQNAALFSLLGVTYGGNGVQNFMLPDLRGRTPIGYGSSADPGWQPTTYVQGTAAGVENVTLLTTNLPTHSHQVGATTQNGAVRSPNNNLYATATAESLYGPSNGPQVPLNAAQIGLSGGNTPHPNMQPFRVINFNIALNGVFPSRG